MRGDTDLAADFLSEYFSAFRNHESFEVLLQLFWTAPIGHDDRQFNEIGHSAGTYDNCRCPLGLARPLWSLPR